MKKITIIVDDCIKCPLECDSWKGLTNKQRFKLSFGIGVKEFILKDCPLPEMKFKINGIKRVMDLMLNLLELLKKMECIMFLDTLKKWITNHFILMKKLKQQIFLLNRKGNND